MIFAELPNPFRVSKLDDTITLPAGDVPSLHESTLQVCQQHIKQLVGPSPQEDYSSGLLIIGEAGSGKSHLIAQLRQRLAKDSTVVLASVPMRGAYAGRLWRHLRKQLFVELFHEFQPGESVRNGLERILQNQFHQPTKVIASQGDGQPLMNWLFGAKSAESLKKQIQKLAETHNLDYPFQKVLQALAQPDLRVLARKWLEGDQLTDGDQKRLDLPLSHPDEQETDRQSREVVLSLLRLAGRQTRLVLCFDEVEAIQSGSYDENVLRQLGALLTDVLAQTGPRAVFTFIRPRLMLDMQRAVEVSVLQKIGQATVTIPPLSWEQSVQIVLARLEADPKLQQLRKVHERYWPLGEPFIRQVFREHQRVITPRHLIRACAVEFERLRGAQVPPSPPPGDDTPPPLAVKLQRLWEKKRRSYLEKPASLQFDLVLRLAIPWLVRLTALPLEEQPPPADQGDVNLLFAKKPTGRVVIALSFCNQEPHQLWRRLDRIRVQWQRGRQKALTSLHLLRFSETRTTDNAQQRFDKLLHSGAQLLLLPRQQLAELAAYQVLMTAALEGDLTSDGAPVPIEEFDNWARETLSSSIKEFLDSLFPEVAAQRTAPVIKAEPSGALS